MAKNKKSKVKKVIKKKAAKPAKKPINAKSKSEKTKKEKPVKAKKVKKLVKTNAKIKVTTQKSTLKPKSVAKTKVEVKKVEKTKKVEQVVTVTVAPKAKPMTPEMKRQTPPPIDIDAPPRGRGRQPKVVKPKIIKTNVIMPKLVEEMSIQKVKKEPPGKFQLEFVVHASPSLLFEFFSTPPGLSEWFSDDVNIRDGIYTFYWDGQQQNAKVIGLKEDQFIRFQWVDRNDGSYFEFRIATDELTNDVSLLITDFAETPADAETSKLLWNSQVGKLLQVLGAY